MTIAGTGLRASSPPAYRRGYVPPSDAKRLVQRRHKTMLHRTMLTAVSDHVVSLAAVAGALLSYRHLSPPLALFAHASALLVIARCQRGLENLVHEASHYNWTRRRKLNDVLADGLAALPVACRVASYRAGHLVHHRRFGTADDPDLRRYTALVLEELDRTTLRRLARSVAVRLPAYSHTWWQSVGTSRHTAVRTLTWHVCCLVLPAWTAFGLETSIFVWSTWMVAFCLVLPVLRLIAESNEHVYSDARTVFDATLTNLGIVNRMLLHPHNDGFHTLHHLWPGVPHHQLPKLHAALMALDPDGYGSRLRHRTTLLQRPGAVAPLVPLAGES
jgi:fatty acid desaturase